MNREEIKRSLDKATRELAEMVGRRAKPEEIYAKRGEIDGLYARLEERREGA